MLLEILTHTPTWVFVVFALLAWLGGRQLRGGSAHLNRVIAMPLAMVALALSGVIGGFGHSPAGLLAVAAWAAAAAAVFGVTMRLPLNPAVRYDAATRQFFQPGSAVPLVLMMGVFFTKYTVGVLQAMHPEYAHQTAFALGVSALYGAASGVFVGRAVRLWKLAFRHHAALKIA